MSADQSGRTCLILAGGLGTRLRSVVKDVPKSLAPVGRRSFLDILMERLAQAGIADIVLSLGYGADQVIESLERNSPPVPVRTVLETEPLGTGGAIALALDRLSLDEVLVTNGDTYLDGDLSAMLRRLDRSSGELLRMAVVTVSDRRRFGGVQGDAFGRVQRFLEKGQTGSGLINAGLYRLCRAALPEQWQGAYSLETDVLPSLVLQQQVTLSAIGGSFIDIGVPEDYRVFCEHHAD